MIGMLVQPRKPADYVDTVDPGQPKVENHRVGWMVSGLAKGILTARSRVDLITQGFEIDAEGSHDPGFVVDEENPTAVTHARSLRAAPATRPEDEVIGSATLNSMTMVVPPPGVSSMISSVPIASRSPRETARPKPTPSLLGASPRRWNGWNAVSRASAGIPGPRSLILRSTRPATWPALTLTVWLPGDQVSAFSTKLATTRSKRSGSVWTCGSDSDMSTDTPLGSLAQAPDRRGDDLVQSDGTEEDVHCAGLKTAGIEQSSHHAVEAFGLIDRSLQERSGFVRGPGDAGLEEAGERGLDRRQRGSEVMRHRIEEGGPEAVGGRHRLRRFGLLFEFLSLHRLSDLGGEGPEDHPVVGGQPSIEQHEDCVGGEVDHLTAFLGGSKLAISGPCQGLPGSWPSDGGRSPR